ncbi:hypothetical protein H6P81_018517 [Aristolochia fimbriata]|uniref:Kinesin motor domain-containing protein n=1 Tax=Aristolochia fimbriata TaxID=158543 RepID=A0AAV7E267_ARIFI|nr:hypothetical protein H6P81_018517 [Aristolochia fimbriata]
MDVASPPACPPTVTIRRNPRRKVRDTPLTVPDKSGPVPARLEGIAPFPLQDLLEPDTHLSAPEPSQGVATSESLRVYLRIKPLDRRPVKNKNGGEVNKKLLRKGNVQKIVEKKNKSNEICLEVNDSRTVTLIAPLSFGSKRVKNEVYEGFSHVFPPNSVQEDVYNAVMEPLVQDFMEGKSGLLAALGPTGSGKTHTVFGSPRGPGLVPRALQRLFNNNTPSEASDSSGSYYLSIFEIYSEGGKKEKLLDLSSDGADLSFHQSSIKGLQEVEVSNVIEAERVIARGMLQRATAETNANSQSSRSQCIITVRKKPKSVDNENEVAANCPVLTFVDLAGAERERKTGNQGARLLESNFINNTSMVFGLCLRSLLEHQKNPKRPLQKHYQNSLLTQYLRDYLEGKKRMTLILTVKPGVEDYSDTSFVLRQASPYTKIKYNCIEEFHGVPCQKRPIAMLTQAEKAKRRRCNEMTDAQVDTRSTTANGNQAQKDEITANPEHAKAMSLSPVHSCPSMHENSVPTGGDSIEIQGTGRTYQIMRDFSRALWNVLKEYKQKVEVSESEVLLLRGSVLALTESQRIDKLRIGELEKELQELRLLNRSAEVNHNKMKVDGDDGTLSEVAYLGERLSGANEIVSDEKVTGNHKTGNEGTAPVASHSHSDVSLSDGSSLVESCVDIKVSSGEEDGCPLVESCLDIKVSSVEELPQSLAPESEEVCCKRGHEAKEVEGRGRKTNSLSESSHMEKPRSCIWAAVSPFSIWWDPLLRCIRSCILIFRRLLPASSMLLKEINELGLEDENSKNERGKKKNAAEVPRSQGSISLVRLLTSNLGLQSLL